MPVLPSEKKLVRVATCMPRQYYNREDKFEWLADAISRTSCDLFLTPQEYFGGHYVMKSDLHMDRDWVVEQVGQIAKQEKVHIGVGACCKSDGTGATEDYLYIDPQGRLLGYHSKFALPSYDDMRSGGHGQLWPETNYRRRITPVELPELRLKVGTVFCWEVFSQTLFPAYSMQGVNLIAHPIKFAPRGWLKNEKLSDGLKHIVGFGNAPKSEMWVDRLIMASRHQSLCPIAVSCNSWDLGEKMMALVGYVDEVKKTTNLKNIPSIGANEEIVTFEMLPEYYEGFDHHHSAGAFKAHVGSVEGFSEMGEWTMHAKIRRLESHFLGGTTLMDCSLKAAAINRQKQSIAKRLGGGKQSVKRAK